MDEEGKGIIEKYVEMIKNEIKTEEDKKLAESAITTFSTLGVSLAVVLSWSINQSIWWAIFHGILSWFYVIYFVIRH
jgi:hypothetical protein